VHAVILAGGRAPAFGRAVAHELPSSCSTSSQADHAGANRCATSAANPAGAHLDGHQFEQAAEVKKQLPAAARSRILTEPVGRNTAARDCLAALPRASRRAWRRPHGRTPSDHYIANPERYRIILRAHWGCAPRRPHGRPGYSADSPETGYGYIERMVTARIRKAFPFTLSAASPKNRRSRR